MYKLVMDTASDYYYLAILNDFNILSERYEKGFSNHSETLMPNLEGMLLNNNISLKDIKEVYVGIGPGSYTGERIAVVIAKMLAEMNEIQLYKFSTLALIASSKTGEVYPYIDARRGNAYIAHFDNHDNLKRLMDDQVQNIDEFFIDKDKSLLLSSATPNIIALLKSDEIVKVDDPSNLTPNYIQLVEAERKRRGLVW